MRENRIENCKLFSKVTVFIAVVVFAVYLGLKRIQYPEIITMASVGSPAVVKALGSHTATLIFLHGLGDTGHGWSQMFQQVFAQSQHLKHMKGVFPHAPVRPVTLNMGMKMPAWNDIYGLDPGSDVDSQGLKDSCVTLDKLVDEEVAAGIARERIIVGGFSQGGMVAMHYAYTCCKEDKAVGGVVALSSWVGDRQKLGDTLKGASDKSKYPLIFMGHGEADPLVKFEFGRMSSEMLKASGINVTFKSYPGMMHSSCDQELADVAAFLKDRTP